MNLFREIWSENDCFGKANMSPEEEFLALREIFFADLGGEWYFQIHFFQFYILEINTRFFSMLFFKPFEQNIRGNRRIDRFENEVSRIDNLWYKTRLRNKVKTWYLRSMSR